MRLSDVCLFIHTQFLWGLWSPETEIKNGKRLFSIMFGLLSSCALAILFETLSSRVLEKGCGHFLQFSISLYVCESLFEKHSTASVSSGTFSLSVFWLLLLYIIVLFFFQRTPSLYSSHQWVGWPGNREIFVSFTCIMFAQSLKSLLILVRRYTTMYRDIFTPILFSSFFPYDPIVNSKLGYM